MTTGTTFRDSWLRERLANVTQWPDATLLKWINQAICDYSMYFSCYATATITAVATQREYSLSSYTGIRRILWVEWPNGQNPPEYLVWRSEGEGGFWGGKFYDVRGLEAPAVLVIGTAPALGQNIDIAYAADHAQLSVIGDTLTVLDRHLEGLALFVWWKAAQELLAAEAWSPSVSLLVTEYDMLAYRAVREYRFWVKECQNEWLREWREGQNLRVVWEGRRR